MKKQKYEKKEMLTCLWFAKKNNSNEESFQVAWLESNL